MPNFIVNENAQSNGDHEVHNTTDGCSYMPKLENQIALGYHSSCHEAVSEAKRTQVWPDSTINGCYYCCTECNTG